jgi:hypothetical protein
MNEQHHPDADGLRDRLAAVDPARRVSIDPIPDHLMEHIMTTTPTLPDTPTGAGHSAPSTPGRRWKPAAALGGVAAAVAATAIGVATLGGGNAAVTAEPIELTGGNDALASCLPFSVDILAEMPTAFEGTVTAVDGPTVTLEIDRWFADTTGSAAETAVVNAPEGMEALIGGIAFEPGSQYLISADAEGNVSYCGYTAPATDELRASFEAAFPG